MKVLLDTNFILTCAKEKIDFDSLANEIFDEKIEWIVPCEVLNEIEKIKNSSGPGSKERLSSQLCLEILKSIKPQIVKLGGKSPNIDVRIINYLRGKNIILATLDKELKKRAGGKILTLRGKKKLEIT